MFVKKTEWVFTLSITAIILFAGCSGKPNSEATGDSASRKLQTAIAIARWSHSESDREVTGMVQSTVEATVSSKMMGRIEQIFVAEGDSATAGDLLLQIDDRAAQANLEQTRASLAAARNAEKAAQAGVQAAETGAELARITYRRYSQLLTQESVAQQEFDEIEARYQQAIAARVQAQEMQKAARNQVEQAVAAETAAKIQLQDAKIRAPFAGIITAKLVDPGDLAAPGMPLLKIEKPAAKQVHAYFPEAVIANLKQSQPVTVSIPALAIEELQGTIQTILPAADPRSRSFLVKIDIPDNGSLRSGLFARVRVETPGQRKLQIPRSAVIHQGQLKGIFLVGDDHIARFRLIRTGEQSGAQVEIVSGIKDGERYIRQPPPKLRDGDRVEAE